MIDHDRNVGAALDHLDELGIADNTFVMYSTDNGPHMNTWPDGAMTPFRSEKDTNWEGRLSRSSHRALAGQDQVRRSPKRDCLAPRLAAHLPRHGRRCERRGEAQERLHSTHSRPPRSLAVQRGGEEANHPPDGASTVSRGMEIAGGLCLQA